MTFGISVMKMHLSQVCLRHTPKGQRPSRARQRHDPGCIEEMTPREGTEAPGKMAQGTNDRGLGTKDLAQS